MTKEESENNALPFAFEKTWKKIVNDAVVGLGNPRKVRGKNKKGKTRVKAPNINLIFGALTPNAPPNK